MTRLVRGAILAAAMLAAAAAWGQQTLLGGQSDIAFVSRQMGASLEGHFRKFDAQIAFDPRKPEAGSIRFTVDLASATLGAPELEAELAKAPWFNLKAFPQASFQSTGIRATGPGRFDVTGTLTLKGSAQVVTVPVALVQAGGTTTASGSFVIQRLKFRIGEGEWGDPSLVADDVLVKLRLVMGGVAPL